MKKIRDLRLLIGAAALATAGTSAGFAIAATVAPVAVQADPSCEIVMVNGATMVDRCFDPGAAFGSKCVPASTIPPVVSVDVCVPD